MVICQLTVLYILLNSRADMQPETRKEDVMMDLLNRIQVVNMEHELNKALHWRIQVKKPNP